MAERDEHPLSMRIEPDIYRQFDGPPSPELQERQAAEIETITTANPVHFLLLFRTFCMAASEVDSRVKHPEPDESVEVKYPREAHDRPPTRAQWQHIYRIQEWTTRIEVQLVNATNRYWKQADAADRPIVGEVCTETLRFIQELEFKVGMHVIHPEPHAWRHLKPDNLTINFSRLVHRQYAFIVSLVLMAQGGTAQAADAPKITLEQLQLPEDRAAAEEEWSYPMTKAEMQSRLKLNQRSFGTFTKTYPIKQIGKQLWQIRVDQMDAQTRLRLYKERPPPPQGKRGAGGGGGGGRKV